MGEMSKDEVSGGLFDECKRLQARVAEMEGQLNYEKEIKAEYLAMLEKRDNVALERQKLVNELQAENEALRDVLEALVDLKELKDNYGKPKNYEELKAKLWPKARRILSSPQEPKDD